MIDAAIRPEFNEQKIDAIFADLDQSQLPGAAVGVAIDAEPVYRKGFGLANMELPVVLSPAIRMRIGSTTKHFVCLAYLLLCEQGRAGLDDPIGALLPELHPCAHDVTSRQLMGHISGLRDAVDISWYFSGTGQAVTAGELVSMYRDIDSVNFVPGTTFSYNNGGYVLLTEIIERLTGKPLEEVLRERIFDPIGMYHTLLRRFDSDFVTNSATLHMSRVDGGFDKSYLGTALTGEGGLVSTVDDMLRWLSHMDAPTVGSPFTWQTIKSPQVLTNGTSTGYGLGLITERYGRFDTLSHAGGVMGGNSQMIKVPSAGLDIIVILNRHDVLGLLLANRIIDSCLGASERPETPPDDFAPEGIFRSPTTQRVVELLVKEHQQFASIDGYDLPVAFDRDGLLKPLPGYRSIKQELALLGDPRAPTSIRLNDFGNLDELLPVEAATIGIEPIAGVYRSDPLQIEASIGEHDGRPSLITKGRFGSAEFNLQCLSKDIWRARSCSAMPWGGILRFDPRQATMWFTSTRNRNLAFRRSA